MTALAYQVLFDISEDAVFIISKEGRILLANHVAHKRYGLSKEKTGEIAFQQFETKPSQLSNKIDQIIEAGLATFESEHEFVGRGATPVGVSCRTIEYQKQGALLVVARDISERFNAQIQMRKNAETLRRTQLLAHIGSWIWDIKNEQMEWSQELFNIFALPAESKAPSLFDQSHLYTPESWAKLHSALEEILSNGGGFSLDLQVLPADGQMKWVVCSGEPILDDQQTIVTVLGSIQDITNRKRIEKDLEQSKIYLRNVINALGDPVFVKDSFHRFMLVNDELCKVVGTTQDHMIGKSDLDFFPKKHVDVYWKEDDDVLETGEGSQNSEEILDSNGKSRQIVTKKTRFIDDRGNRFIVGSIRDVTEHEETKRLLWAAQKNEAIGQLAGSIAHDFNNILTVINISTNFALESLPKDHAVRADLEEVRKAGDRAAILTTRLLAFSRKQVLKSEIVSVNEVVTGMKDLLHRLLDETIELATLLHPDLWNIKADISQLEQVIMNLVVNSRDAMPKGGRITIETGNVDFDEEMAKIHSPQTAGSYVMLAVSDNGMGMSEEVKKRLFEPFFTTKEIGKGTGLGLATVYGIIKQSEAFIWPYSETNKGTTFKIYFPRSRQPTEVTESYHGKSVVPAKGERTILVVEDETSVRNMISRILKKAGYRVILASHGEEAMQNIQRETEPIHLLLTDIVMPKMGGKPLAEEIRKTNAHMRILFMSGYTDGVIREQGMLEPGTYFIAKPFTAAELTKRIRQILEA